MVRNNKFGHHEMTSKKIDRIFCKPEFSKDEYISKHGVGYSSLFLLRRDIYWCRGIDPKTNKRIVKGAGAPFAGFILLRVLLNYAISLSNSDMQNYVKKYFPVTLLKDELSALNKLRNALEHQSYNLLWMPNIKKGETGKTILFAMTEESISPLIEKVDTRENDETWIVNIEKLHNAIEQSLDNFYIQLEHIEDIKRIIELADSHEMHVLPREDFVNYSQHRKTIGEL